MKNISCKEKNSKQIIFSSSIFTALLVIWLVTIFIQIPEGTIEDQLLKLRENSYLYRFSFFNASLISIPLSILIIYFSRLIGDLNDVHSTIGIIFLVPYITLVSVAYTSQYTFFNSMLNSDIPLSEIKIWYFYDSSSIIYLLDLLGYVFFGISAIFIGYGALKSKGILKVIGWLLYLSALTAFAGFVGYVLNNELLEQFVLISGGLMLPLGILSIILGKKLYNSQRT